MRKLVKTLVLCSLFLMALTICASADEIAYTTADVLNVRSQPSTSAEIVGQYPYGSQISVTDTADVWYQIRFNSGFAYVHSDYVKFSPDATPDQLALGERVVEKAKQYIGTPYVYGGSSPSGFDCSGFVKYIYSHFGVNLDRVAAAQSRNGYAVSADNMMPGDIICFAGYGGYGYVNHVGIYVGNGQFIHSPRTGYTVCIETLGHSSYGNRIAGVRRIF